MSLSTVGLGYNSAVLLDDNEIFCTSLSMNIGSQIVISQGSFLGNKSSLYAYGTIRQDYPDIQATVTFQATTNDIGRIIKWIKNRTNTISIILKTNPKYQLEYNGYWSNISISVSQGQLLTVSITLIIINKHNYSVQNLGFYNKYDTSSTSKNAKKLIGTKWGNEKSSGLSTPSESFPRIIPYYSTGIDFGDTSETNNRKNYVFGWSLDLTQNILKKTYCGLSSSIGNDASLPGDLVFGILNATLKANVLVAKDMALQGESSTYITFSSADSINSGSSICVKMCGSSLNLFYNLLQSVTPIVTDQQGLKQIQYTYISHKIDC